MTERVPDERLREWADELDQLAADEAHMAADCENEREKVAHGAMAEMFALQAHYFRRHAPRLERIAAAVHGPERFLLWAQRLEGEADGWRKLLRDPTYIDRLGEDGRKAAHVNIEFNADVATFLRALAAALAEPEARDGGKEQQP